MRTIISDEYDVERVEDWCASVGVESAWKPLWCGGQIAGWQADLSADDRLLVRLKFGFEKPPREGRLLSF